MRWRLPWLGLLVLAGLVGLVLLLRPQPVSVEVARVVRGSLDQTVEEDGVTRVSERYVLAAPIAGTVRRVSLKAGDPVVAGAVVAVLVPNPAPMLDIRARQELAQRLGAAEATKERMAANVTRLTAMLAQARVDLERTRVLAARGVVSQSKLEHDELSVAVEARLLDVARHEDHAAAHEVELARAALAGSRPATEVGAVVPEALEIHAPVGGHVLRVMQVSEAPVATGAPLVEIGDVTALEVVIDVLSADAVAIPPGAPAWIERWGGPTVLQGRVRRVEPGAFTKVSALGVEEQRTNVVIDILTPVGERRSLGDGFRVDVRIQVRHLPDVVKLPTSALFRDGARWMVFRVVDGVARLQVVTLTLRTPTETAVSNGVQPGDVVVSFPGDTVADGVRVVGQGGDFHAPAR